MLWEKALMLWEKALNAMILTYIVIDFVLIKIRVRRLEQRIKNLEPQEYFDKR